jgi:hypothetical protein
MSTQLKWCLVRLFRILSKGLLEIFEHQCGDELEVRQPLVAYSLMVFDMDLPLVAHTLMVFDMDLPLGDSFTGLSRLFASIRKRAFFAKSSHVALICYLAGIGAFFLPFGSWNRWSHRSAVEGYCVQ